jgi:DNA-binding transcriptional MerR regulator
VTGVLEAIDGVAADETERLKIGEVSALTGLTPRAIRYYEERGLLPQPDRTAGAFRVYGRQDVARLREIAWLREVLGFSLDDVRDVLAGEAALDLLRSKYRSTADLAVRHVTLEEAARVAAGTLDIVARKLGQLNELKATWEARLNRYRARLTEIEAASQESAGAVSGRGGKGHR